MSHQDLVWALLRDLRATPPGRAASGERRKVFAASMQQFEELWRAAYNSGPASKPLPLFYALSQAGRAISAAHNPENNFRLRGHGLKWKPANDATKPLNALLEVQNGGAFPVISKLTTGAAPAGPLELGGLWYSLPEIAGVHAAGESVQFPKALPTEYFPQTSGLVITRASKFNVRVGWLPNELLTSLDPEGDLRRILDHYPTTEGWEVPSELGLRLDPLDDEHVATVLTWTADGRDEADRRLAFERITVPVTRDKWWIRPAVKDSYDPPIVLSAISTWWGLLYGFSILARYEPDAWVALLDVDTSKYAVPLETALSSAAQAIPKLVLEFLEGRLVFPELYP